MSWPLGVPRRCRFNHPKDDAYVRSDGALQCRICTRRRAKEYKQRKRVKEEKR